MCLFAEISVKKALIYGVMHNNSHQSWVIGIFSVFGIRYRYIPIPKMFRYFGICTDTEYRNTTISVFFPVFIKKYKKLLLKDFIHFQAPKHLDIYFLDVCKFISSLILETIYNYQL